MTDRTPTRPSGMAPPTEAVFEGARVDLVPLAKETTVRHLERHPDDVERYGELAEEWCIHDMQHVIGWAFGDAAGYVDLGQQVGWLCRLLDARGYPMQNMADCLEEAAAVVERQVPGAAAVAARLLEVRPAP